MFRPGQEAMKESQTQPRLPNERGQAAEPNCLEVLYNLKVPQDFDEVVTTFKKAFPDFPFRQSFQTLVTTEQVILRWVAPVALNGFCLFVCSWLLHVTTYNYINQMQQWNDHYELVPKPPRPGNDLGFSFGWNKTDISFGSLNDPVEAWLGYADYSVSTIDKVALFFPFCFLVLDILVDNLRTWTKVLLCNALLALVKGFLGVVTTIPDSAGWAACKARIGAEGLAWMEQERTIWELLWAEIVGIDGGNHLRWCADMMYSGHTYLTTLYALGLYEVVRIVTREWDARNRRTAVIFVAVLGISEQVLEITIVLRNHFHYSMDVSVAIMFTFLFYTNGGIAVTTKWWSNSDINQVGKLYFGKKIDDRDTSKDYDVEDARKKFQKVMEVANRLDKERNHLAPYQVHDCRALITNCEEIVTKCKEADEAGRKIFDRSERNLTLMNNLYKELMWNGGDILVPPCCLPFCCLSGRQHVLTDHHIEQLLQYENVEVNLRELVREKMQVGGGLKLDLEACFQEVSKIASDVADAIGSKERPQDASTNADSLQQRLIG